MKSKFWTFIVEYDGGTYISQFEDVDFIQAIRLYNSTDPSGMGAFPLDEDYTSSNGVISTFYLSGVSSTSNWLFFKKRKVIFANAILTERC